MPSAHVAAAKACAERAKRHGVEVAIAHHTHAMIHDASSFLMLWSGIKDPAPGYPLGIGRTPAQRGYPVVAVRKVKRRLMNLRRRDIGGLMRRFPHTGVGVMDFRRAEQVRDRVGCTGFLSPEQDAHPGGMRATAARYVKLMKAALS